MTGGGLAPDNAAPQPRSWTSALWRGLRGRCPQCGAGKLFAGYTKTAQRCGICDLDLSGHRADDAPPYLTIMVVGHGLIPLALLHKQLFDPPLGLQFAIWTPLIVIATAWLLPVMKGAMLALQWSNHLHGFGADPSGG